jgi:hypothetical protein
MKSISNSSPVNRSVCFFGIIFVSEFLFGESPKGISILEQLMLKIVFPVLGVQYGSLDTHEHRV